MLLLLVVFKHLHKQAQAMQSCNYAFHVHFSHQGPCKYYRLVHILNAVQIRPHAGPQLSLQSVLGPRSVGFLSIHAGKHGDKR